MHGSEMLSFETARPYIKKKKLGPCSSHISEQTAIVILNFVLICPARYITYIKVRTHVQDQKSTWLAKDDLARKRRYLL